MRKPRDYDAELQELNARSKQLKAKRVQQFGELVIAAGADTLGADVLAGALLDAVKAAAATKEAWGVAGAAFFRDARRGASGPRSQRSATSARQGAPRLPAADSSQA